MSVAEIRELIQHGEKIDVEFKKSENKLNKDIYETICSFNNRDGGHLILGISDVTREVCGINENQIDKMLKEFATSINNANKFYPPLYLTPEVHELDGKKIIYIRVPEGTQVRRLNSRIWDRTYEGDIDITDNAELVYKMYARKQSTYFVNKVYPCFGMRHLDIELIKRAKKMALSRLENHPWKDMNEEEILRSMGLILENPEDGREGITLAAILLFGKDSTIMSVLPQYKTDAIYRVKNVDRYDDRDVVCTNLIDSYAKLMDFGKKHLNDSFVLDGDQSISARDKILREIVSNLLAHRDYSSAYTAKLVIENHKMFTENSNLPHGHGELQLNKFEPFPKNPPISKMFREIGLADELGSGMRNTNKYTKLYSGGVPIFEEANVFRITIPMENVANLRVGPGTETEEMTSKVTSKMTSKMTSKVANDIEEKILFFMRENEFITAMEMAEKLGITEESVRYRLKKFKREGKIQYEGSAKKGKWIVNP